MKRIITAFAALLLAMPASAEPFRLIVSDSEVPLVPNSVMELAQHHNVDMPLVREVFDVVQGRANARRAFRGLLRIAAGAESEAG